MAHGAALLILSPLGVAIWIAIVILWVIVSAREIADGLEQYTRRRWDAPRRRQ